MLESATVEIAKHARGKFLLLMTNEENAIDVAAELLALFEAELDASIEDMGWRHKGGLVVDTPTLVRLESLKIEMSTHGTEIRLSHVEGSEYEFDKLCSFIGTHESHTD